MGPFIRNTLSHGAILLALLLAPQPAGAGSPGGKVESKPVTLKSLRPECKLERKWIGAAFDLPWGLWLTCGNGEPMLITQPRNLLGKVRIDSPDAALSFVRFFSSPYNHEMFRLNGLLEITSAAEYWGQDVVEATSLGSRFHPPEVTSTTRPGFCFGARGDVASCEMQEFTVRRLAAFYDNNVYEVVETVSEDGFYTLVSKDLILEDLSRFGLLHIPPH